VFAGHLFSGATTYQLYCSIILPRRDNDMTVTVQLAGACGFPSINGTLRAQLLHHASSSSILVVPYTKMLDGLATDGAASLKGTTIQRA